MSGLLLLRKPSHVRCLSSRLSQVRHYALIGKPNAAVEPRWVLPKTPARTRFAPSPTGYLHLGSLRTALFNYLLAQATGGQFILRLEDTDQSRLVSDAEQVLYDDLRWAGLHWDEGPDKGGPFGPYRQSERLDLYKQHATALLESGRAFRCFCTKEQNDLNVAQAAAGGGAAHYPGTCTHVELGESDSRAANGEPHAIRFKSAEQPVSANDIVYGIYRKAEREDSFIIMKSDGFPTYHFANVVDDHLMEITHVIRGAEWLISTPKHVELYNAFGWKPPNFAHVGLLVDAQRQKLSKRDVANIGIGLYRSSDIQPEALLNFSALLGWDPNFQRNPQLDKKGIMTMAEMKQNFTMKFTRGDIIVDLSRLKFFQSQFLRNLITGKNPDHELLRTRVIQPVLKELRELDERLAAYDETRLDHGPDHTLHDRSVIDSIRPRPEKPELTEDYVLEILRALKAPVEDPVTFIRDNILAFYRPSKESMRKAFRKLQAPMRKIMMVGEHTKLLNTDLSTTLKIFTSKLTRIKPDDWEEKLGDVVYPLTDSVKYYNTQIRADNLESGGWQILRHAVLNGNPGLGILPMMRLLGQKETVHRIRAARKIASEEERAAKLELEKMEAAKVGTRLLTSGPRGEEAKQAANIRSSNQAEDEKTYEPRNLRIVEQKEAKKPLTPAPLGQFAFPGHDVEAWKQQRVKEGPFKARVSTPLPTRSRARDPSEVERAHVLLTFDEFREGMRHFNYDDDRVAAFYQIEELQFQERARRREEEAREAARVQAEERSKAGAWAIPRAAATPAPQEDSYPRSNALDTGVDKKPNVKSVFYISNTRAAELKNTGSQPLAPPADQGTLSQRAEMLVRAQRRDKGPFRPAGASVQIDNVERHVKHLRALNRTQALRKAEAKRRTQRSDERVKFARLKISRAKSLLSVQSTNKQAAEGSAKTRAATGGRDLSLDKLAQELADRKRVVRRATDAEPLRAEAWGTDSGLDYSGKRLAAAAADRALRMKRDHEAAMKRAEKTIADLSSRPRH